MKIIYKLLILIIIVFLLLVFVNFHKQEISNRNTMVSKGIYILYKDGTTRLKYLDAKYKEISDIKLAKAWELCAIEKGKVYASIPGDANSVENKVAVLINGIVEKNIALKYDMPKEITYNKYNKNAYVSHTYKLTYNEENCISVIDTNTDTEINCIMYDEVINDMAFSDNNLMFVASTNAIQPDSNIDIFDLTTNKLVQHIALDINLGSIAYSPKTQLLYGVKDSQKDAQLYVIDYKKGEIIKKISLNYDYPYKLTLTNEDGKEYLYISNVNIDNANEGNVITIFNIETQKIEKEITKAEGLHDYCIDDSIYVVARMENEGYIISSMDKITKKIKIPFPISIVITD